MVNTPTFATPREAADWWIDLGFSPVPIPSGSKNPGLLHDKWEGLRIDHSNASQYFDRNPQNLGLLLGLNEATDVDLDSPEARSAGAVLLPPTGMVWGRGSAPRSHYLYRSPGAVTKQFKDPVLKKPITELRARKKDGGIGAQSVVPPGVHPSGELIRFDSCVDPATVSPQTLLSAVSKTAAAALLASQWPDHGRHDAMLALAGVLARAGWSQDGAQQFCRALYQAVPTHDPAQLDRSNSEVESTFAKKDAGEEITGFPSLVKTIDQHVIATALEWLGIRTKDGDWHTHLIRGKDGGEPKRVMRNACIALRTAPAWAEVLARDEFARRTVALNTTPWGAAGNWREEDDLRFTDWLHHEGIFVSSKVAAEAVETVAAERKIHPVREYLGLLDWDGKGRIDHWLTNCLGAEESEYSRAVGARWLISAVARIFQPGCQADSTLVLQGAQGTLKSTALRTLAGDKWFSDHISELASKDSRLELADKWIIELSELDRVRRGELERVKAFLTCRVDHFRPPYGRRTEAVSRSCVFAGTSNADTPLSDETGSRRFWLVSCGRVGPVDLASIKNSRDLLWAEAVARYRSGCPWWLETSELTALAENEQRARYEPGARDELIRRWIADPTRQETLHDWDEQLPWFDSRQGRINVTDVLCHGLEIPKSQIKATDSREVARCLRFLGYQYEQERAGKFRGVRYYVGPASRPEFLNERQ